jgi:hypothetical protein
LVLVAEIYTSDFSPLGLDLAVLLPPPPVQSLSQVGVAWRLELPRETLLIRDAATRHLLVESWNVQLFLISAVWKTCWAHPSIMNDHLYHTIN